ncbi:MAG: hypothetical protein MK098_06785 [Marinovum sp.]|nr:hypothetical protein [Marinovum sp.]
MFTDIPAFLETVIASALGFFIAGFGKAWFDAKIKQANNLEDGRDADVDEIIQITKDVAALAETYWFSVANDDDLNLQSRITTKINHISALSVGIFENDEDALSEAYRVISALDTAITHGDFGSKLRQAEPRRLTEILSKSMVVERTMRTQRRKLSPRWFGMI